MNRLYGVTCEIHSAIPPSPPPNSWSPWICCWNGRKSISAPAAICSAIRCSGETVLLIRWRSFSSYCKKKRNNSGIRSRNFPPLRREEPASRLSGRRHSRRPAKHPFRAVARTHFGKEENTIKDTTFSIRISTKDLETIREKAKLARLSQSDYVTRCCLGRQVVVVEDLKEVHRQLRAIGTNLNRLTTLANMGKIQTVYLDQTVDELAKVSAALREIQERGRWRK
ncbi:MobC family plasmid mobilization relaxosome protein [Hydrogenoanaerobacterium saccharovorans]|uniref:MobC family plasmid mobilization relaxosome protein n=1 Tax=Hydrogenoanaerobacterium saccharovorans TaxID=474960 RepID=A0ABS2GLN3_9FIRM|nr:MobC family plasmid mobilization relaxosome protein [Hydrogenoanaerobacterium saccharovorans]